MNNIRTVFEAKKVFILLAFIGVSLLFPAENLKAQVATELPDIPIDPNALKNASPAELQSYLKDFNQRQQNRKPGDDIHRGLTELPKDQIAKDSTQKDDFKKKVFDPRDTYGADLFHARQIVELTALSTPPEDYPIGVGDHIIVSLWGGADFEQDYIVARDGTIFPQGLGKITVQGLTFANARAIIYDRFRRVIPLSTNISISLGQPRSIIVQASGNVENPGPIVVSAFTNALNVIALAGGVTEFGNLRNILISRNGKVIDTVDVYKYLNTGDYGKHLYLENNDFIIVPFYDKKVLASGQFKRPMYYQLKKNEGVLDLLKYAGGFTSDAYSSGGSIIRNTEEKQTIKSINFNALGLKAQGSVTDEPLYDGDMVIVNLINPGLKNKAIVRGEVAYPNVYEVRPGDRLFDLINRAGGITPNSFLDRAYVYKGAGDSTNLKSDKIDVTLNDLNKNLNSSQNILIEPNDVIEVFNINQFVDKQMIKIEGEVRNPGEYNRYGGMTLKDLLFFAGGLKPSAEFGSIVVSSIVDIDSSQRGLKPTKNIVRAYEVSQNLALDSVTENVKLKPYDQIFVRKNPNFKLQQNITLNGEVLYPGTYPKIMEQETISSIIHRAGGLKENANLNGAKLFRVKDSVFSNSFSAKINKTRYIRDTAGLIIDSVVFDSSEPIIIDLENAIKSPGSKYDVVLKEGDVLIIPEINPVVTIKGAVQSQLKMYVDEDHTNLMYYIDRAGGFGVRPWKKRIYVTYANGKSRKTKNFGIFHFYPKVEAGSIVVIPTRPEGKGLGNFASQVLITSVPIFVAFLLTKAK
jgi:protein involved in polysaccharide export with SLBB domain